MNQISDALRRYRRDNGLSVAELASTLSISRDCLSALERGSTLPTLPTLRSVARLIQWTTEELGQVILALPDAPRLRYAEAPDVH